MTNEKKCKHLCTDCEYYSKECSDFDATCEVYEKDIISCVDGTETIELAFCKNHNIDGCCKKYKPKAHLKLMRLLEQHLKTIPRDWAGRDTIEEVLIEDLLHMLNGGDSQYFEVIYTDDSPYGHQIVVNKKAIEKSIEKRKYKLKYKKDGNLYGQFCKYMTEEEVVKEKSWLSMMKSLLGLKE